MDILIPPWVVDFASLRRWMRSGGPPEKSRFSYLNGELHVDLAREKIWHNQVKGAIFLTVGGLVHAGEMGLLLVDGMYLTNPEVELITRPDGMFVCCEAIASRKVFFPEGGDSLEVIGTPDMTLEVVSPTTVHKDTEVLRDQYWEAGIEEYWLVQAEGDDFILDILRHAASGYVSTRKSQGWVKSKVFGKSFRLVQEPGDAAGSNFALEMR